MSLLLFHRTPHDRPPKARYSRAAEWIAALYIALVIATPVLIFEGPRVLPAFEQAAVSQVAKTVPAHALAR